MALTTLTRLQLSGPFEDASGNAQTAYKYYVYATGTSTQASCYDAATAGNLLTQPLTGTSGGLPGSVFLLPGDYDVSSTAGTVIETVTVGANPADPLVTGATASATYPTVFAVAAASGDTTGVADLAAIQAKIDAAFAAGGGGVSLRAGTYYAKGIVPKANVTIFGAGMTATIVKNPAASALSVFDGSTSVPSGCEIRDLTIDGTNGSATAGNGIIIVGASKFAIRRVKVLNPWNHGIYANTSTDFIIESCQVNNAGTGANVTDNSRGGITLDTDCQRFRVVNNIVDTTKGAAIGNILRSLDGVISGNIVKSAGFIGIAAGSSATRLAITGNVVTTTVDNGIDTGNGTSVAVVGNTINGTTLSGISCDFSYAGTQNPADCTFSNNTITGAGQAAIYVVGPPTTGTASGFTISGNTIQSCTATAILLSAVSKSLVIGNIIRNVVGNAIALSGQSRNNRIIGNVIYDDRGTKLCYGLAYAAGTQASNIFFGNETSQTLGNFVGTLAGTDYADFSPPTGRVSGATPGNAAASAVTTVPMATYDWDSGGFTGTANRVTAPQTGKYLLSIGLDMANDATGTQRALWGAKNGSDSARLAPANTVPGPLAWQVQSSAVVSLVAGDYVELHIYQDSSVVLAINTDNGTPYLSLTKIA